MVFDGGDNIGDECVKTIVTAHLWALTILLCHISMDITLLSCKWMLNILLNA